MKTYKVRPIGFVNLLSEIDVHVKNKNDIVSELIIYEEFEECLYGIEYFSHLLVIFWPHELDAKQRNIKKVHPRRNHKKPLLGVFATRSQARPNPLLITIVKLLKKSKSKLKVKGLDAYDNTPILDIKPYIPYFDFEEEGKCPKWVEKLED